MPERWSSAYLWRISLGAIALVVGCYGPAHGARDEWERSLLSVRFDSARDVIAIPNGFAANTTRETLADVTGLGGRVTAYGRDTLVIEPFYITRYDAARSDGQRTFGKGGVYGLPDLALIVPDSGVYISEYQPPGLRRSRILEQTLVVGPSLILFVGGMYSFFHHHW